MTRMHVVLDNLRMHKGKKVQAWLAEHPRFVFSFPPVHGSWMNQVEQWCSILQRKRLRIADFADKKHLAERLLAFVAEWNEHAHPFPMVLVITDSVDGLKWGCMPPPHARCARFQSPPTSSHIEVGMATGAHAPTQGYRTIRWPWAESEEDRLLTDGA